MLIKPFKWKWASWDILYFCIIFGSFCANSWSLIAYWSLGSKSSGFNCWTICSLYGKSFRLWRILRKKLRDILSSVERLRVDVVGVSSTLSLTLSRFSSVLTFWGLPVRGRSDTAPCCSKRRTILLIALSLGHFSLGNDVYMLFELK